MTSVIGAITSVFTAVGEWFSTALGGFVDIFYVEETGITFLGTVALVGLGISITMLLINIVKSFIKFK